MALRSVGFDSVLITASESGIDLVKAIAVRPNNTMALPDNGLTMEPIIVAVKIASNRHDSGLIPSGGWIMAIAMPLPITTVHLRIKVLVEVLPGGSGEGATIDRKI